MRGGAAWTAGAAIKVIEGPYLMRPTGDLVRNYDIAVNGQRFLMLKAVGSDATSFAAANRRRPALRRGAEAPRADEIDRRWSHSQSVRRADDLQNGRPPKPLRSAMDFRPVIQGQAAEAKARPKRAVLVIQLTQVTPIRALKK